MSISFTIEPVSDTQSKSTNTDSASQASLPSFIKGETATVMAKAPTPAVLPEALNLDALQTRIYEVLEAQGLNATDCDFSILVKEASAAEQAKPLTESLISMDDADSALSSLSGTVGLTQRLSKLFNCPIEGISREEEANFLYVRTTAPMRERLRQQGKGPSLPTRKKADALTGTGKPQPSGILVLEVSEHDSLLAFSRDPHSTESVQTFDWTFGLAALDLDNPFDFIELQLAREKVKTALSLLSPALVEQGIFLKSRQPDGTAAPHVWLPPTPLYRDLLMLEKLSSIHTNDEIASPRISDGDAAILKQLNQTLWQSDLFKTGFLTVDTIAWLLSPDGLRALSLCGNRLKTFPMVDDESVEVPDAIARQFANIVAETNATRAQHRQQSLNANVDLPTAQTLPLMTPVSPVAATSDGLQLPFSEPLKSPAADPERPILTLVPNETQASDSNEKGVTSSLENTEPRHWAPPFIGMLAILLEQAKWLQIRGFQFGAHGTLTEQLLQREAVTRIRTRNSVTSVLTHRQLDAMYPTLQKMLMAVFPPFQNRLMGQVVDHVSVAQQIERKTLGDDWEALRPILNVTDAMLHLDEAFHVLLMLDNQDFRKGSGQTESVRNHVSTFRDLLIRRIRSGHIELVALERSTSKPREPEATSPVSLPFFTDEDITQLQQAVEYRRVAIPAQEDVAQTGPVPEPPPLIRIGPWSDRFYAPALRVPLGTRISIRLLNPQTKMFDLPALTIQLACTPLR